MADNENEKEVLEDEIHNIDKRLKQIQQQIDELEDEKQAFLFRKQECKKQLKAIMPSSVGGNQNDNLSEWSNTNSFPWSKNLDTCLSDVFHLSKFRPLQLETINVTLSKHDCIVIMPTGGGKSLTFQLPSCVENGITLVVSPLISLIEDQIWSLKRLNINAVTLNAATSKEELNEIQKEMSNKNTKLKIIYVTPEKLAKSKKFMNKLEKMYELDLFKRLVIDEIHCCSTFGHDFRPDYKFLGIMKRQFPSVPILGLTATATNYVIDDIKKILNLQKCVLFKSTFNRPNIFYEVRVKPSSQADCINEISQLIKDRFPKESGIVYCFSQRESEEVAQELCSRGHKADFYHAQLPANMRSRVHERWIRNELHIIVATIAFGMGIDKSSVKFVIHHSLSKSLENFYQESGRAGRNNELAYSVLYFRFADVFRQSAMVFTEQTGLTNLYSMVNYCVNNTVCKRKTIAHHFNDTLNELCNEMCDYCKSLAGGKISNYKINFINEAKCILECLDRHTSSASAKSKDKRLTANKLSELAYHDVNKKLGVSRKLEDDLTYTISTLDVERLILDMIKREYLKEDFHFTPYNTICYLIKSFKKIDNEREYNVIINLNQKSAVKNGHKPSSVRAAKKQQPLNSEDIVILDDDDNGDEDFDVVKIKKRKLITLDDD